MKQPFAFAVESPLTSKRGGGNTDPATHIRQLHISRILLGHAQHQFYNLLRDRRASGGFPALALVPVCGLEFSMPAKDGFGSHDGGKLVEHLAAEDLAFDGEPASLVVVEENSFLSELLPEYPILSEEVLAGVLDQRQLHFPGREM